jgi:hypothetical protein
MPAVLKLLDELVLGDLFTYPGIEAVSHQLMVVKMFWNMLNKAKVLPDLDETPCCMHYVSRLTAKPIPTDRGHFI